MKQLRWENTSPNGNCQVPLSASYVSTLNSLGKRLRVARLGALERVGREYSQGQLGAALGGVSGQAVSAWEGDVSPPTVDAIAKMAQLLGVTPGWLAFGQEPRFPPAIDHAPAPPAPVAVAQSYEEQRAATKKTATKRRARGE